jgi:hypothetical protein
VLAGPSLVIRRSLQGKILQLPQLLVNTEIETSVRAVPPSSGASATHDTRRRSSISIAETWPNLPARQGIAIRRLYLSRGAHDSDPPCTTIREDQRLHYRPDRRLLGDQKKPRAAEFTIPHKRCKRQAPREPSEQATVDVGSLSNAGSIASQSVLALHFFAQRALVSSLDQI